MKQTVYTLSLIICLMGCAAKVTIKHNIINNLANGLYYKGDLFVKVDGNSAYPEYISESSEYIGLREAFADRLIKESDSLFIGRKFSSS